MEESPVMLIVGAPGCDEFLLDEREDALSFMNSFETEM